MTLVLRKFLPATPGAVGPKQWWLYWFVPLLAYVVTERVAGDNTLPLWSLFVGLVLCCVPMVRELAMIRAGDKYGIEFKGDGILYDPQTREVRKRLKGLRSYLWPWDPAAKDTVFLKTENAIFRSEVSVGLAYQTSDGLGRTVTVKGIVVLEFDGSDAGTIELFGLAHRNDWAVAVEAWTQSNFREFMDTCEELQGLRNPDTQRALFVSSLQRYFMPQVKATWGEHITLRNAWFTRV